MFKKKKIVSNIKPVPKSLYAWNAIHAGSFLLFVESLNDCYRFIFLPGPSDYYLTIKDFESCMLNNTLEFVETLPNDIYEESVRISLACPLQSAKIESNENTH